MRAKIKVPNLFLNPKNYLRKFCENLRNQRNIKNNESIKDHIQDNFKVAKIF